MYLYTYIQYITCIHIYIYMYMYIHTHTHTYAHTYTLQHAIFCVCADSLKKDILQHTATQCNTMQYTATHCNTLQHTATHCNTLQHTTTHCHTLPHTATHRNTPQHTATHYNTLQHAGVCVRADRLRKDIHNGAHLRANSPSSFPRVRARGWEATSDATEHIVFRDLLFEGLFTTHICFHNIHIFSQRTDTLIGNTLIGAFTFPKS